jgi:hypothetical protein
MMMMMMVKRKEIFRMMESRLDRGIIILTATYCDSLYI